MAKTKALKVAIDKICFGSICVLQEISFVLDVGEFLMILGPNGAGKSVLMKAILGLIDFEGEVEVLGKKIDQARSQIGYVPQYIDFDRSFPITVEEVVSLGLIGRKVRNIGKRVEEVLDLVDMKTQKKSFFGSLSGGQTRRVLLARALIPRPKILFLDEPLAGVDVVGEESFYELIARWHKQLGLTTIMISHDYDLVGRVATKILCVNKTKLCFGGPNELTSDNFQKTFGNNLKVHMH